MVLTGLFSVGGLATAQTSTLTYENWAEGFFAQNCTSCHHSSLSGEERFGAPRTANFDTLDRIRAQAKAIREAVLSDDPYMPPSGVAWWWDRDSLREWMDSGMPGGSEALEPIEKVRTRKSQSYQGSSFYLYKESNAPETDRVFRIRPNTSKDHRVPTERRYYFSKAPDGSVVLTRYDRHDADFGTRRFDYNPGIPVLLLAAGVGAPDWVSSVEVRERFWKGPTYKTPETESLTSENWRVSVKGIETVDNGVMLPVQGLKVVQSNLSKDMNHTWWFSREYGIVRRMTDFPSAEYDREAIVEYNILEREDDPLRDPPVITAANGDWFPFVGSRHTEEKPQLSYSYRGEYQEVALLDAAASPTPKPTEPPLGPDPTVPPVLPTPTFTPVPFSIPGTSTNPIPGEYSTADPRISDLMTDNIIDQKDLLIFLQHWHKSID